jgi:hypothetical protein
VGIATRLQSEWKRCLFEVLMATMRFLRALNLRHPNNVARRVVAPKRAQAPNLNLKQTLNDVDTRILVTESRRRFCLEASRLSWPYERFPYMVEFYSEEEFRISRNLRRSAVHEREACSKSVKHDNIDTQLHVTCPGHSFLATAAAKWLIAYRCYRMEWEKEF